MGDANSSYYGGGTSDFSQSQGSFVKGASGQKKSGGMKKMTSGYGSSANKHTAQHCTSTAAFAVQGLKAPTGCNGTEPVTVVTFTAGSTICG